MSNAIFPTLDGLKWDRARTPTWKTSVKEAASGKEWRWTSASSPRWLYALSYEFLREGSGYTELQQIVGLFNACRGSWDSFLYLDPNDSTATAQQFGTGDGTTTQFQLVRAFGSFVEPVAAIVGAPQIYKAGVLQATPGDYSVTAGGAVSFVTPPSPGQSLTWTGQFYWRCRFLRDELEFGEFLEDLWNARRVEFKTVKGES